MKKTIVGSKKDACEKRARSPSSGNTDNEALYSDVNGALSTAIPKEKGLFQGSLLSPSLFNWYINDLA